MEFRQTTVHADREMFNADAVIRCGRYFSRARARVRLCGDHQVELPILRRYHPCNLPRWRRRKTTASSHMVAQTDLMDGPASTALRATMQPRRKAVLISAPVASARYFDIVGISNRTACAADVMQEKIGGQTRDGSLPVKNWDVIPLSSAGVLAYQRLKQIQHCRPGAVNYMPSNQM